MNIDNLVEEYMSITFKRRKKCKPDTDLNRGESGVIFYLSFVKDNIKAGELSEKLNLSTGRVAIILKSLVRKGYVTKKTSQVDARIVRVSVTDNGKKLALKLQNNFRKHMNYIFNYIGYEDTKNFIRILKKVYEAEKRETSESY